MLSHKVNYLPFICNCEYQLAKGTMDAKSGYLYDTSPLEYFPAANVCYGIRKPSKDRFDVYLDVEDYLPEHIRVKVIDGCVVVKGRNKRREAGGWVEQQFSRRCPLPPGLKPEGLLSNYLANGTLNITATLVKCEEGVVVEKTEDQKPADKISSGPTKVKTDNFKMSNCALEAENALDQTVKNFEKGLVLTATE